MTKYILLLVMATALGGCASVGGWGTDSRWGQKRKVERAAVLLEKGHTTAAGELLAAVSAGPAVPGVTDEALFRLSLIHLGSNEKGGVARARNDLERLKKEYPSGSWTPLASILNDVLASTETLQLQNRKLKELNSSLTKENKEFRQNLEKLKNIELDLWRDNKH